MNDKTVKDAFMEVVVNQLETGDPPETKATLTQAADTYFSAIGARDGVTHHYPYSSVIHVMEKEGGVEVGGLFTHKHAWTLVVKVGHVVDVGPMV